MFFNNNRERHIIRLVCMVTMVGFLVAGCGGNLSKATSKNDLNETRKIINDGADVNAADKNGYTPLCSPLIRGILT